MLSELPYIGLVPSSDLDRSRDFYERVLGLTPIMVVEDEVVAYGSGRTVFEVYLTSADSIGVAQHTQGAFVTENLEADIDRLRSRGLNFEEYDEPGFQSEDGIVHVGAVRSAFFKDPDENILVLSEAEPELLESFRHLFGT